jgi:hypothetical protein
MKRVLLAGAVCAVVLAGAGCGLFLGSAISHYDACAAQTSSFKEMIECGRRSRNAACQAEGACSSGGNSIVAYGDTLVASVDAKEMSEPEARRRWIEFKMAEEREERSANRSVASAPRSCTRIGAMTHCF